ncbi:MAG TPA: hypothetical protein VE733_13720 [Streptosporangiaceae bacterium]|nr:hypothetical protein [Streptosporangiaceae bacterium]
MSSDRGTTMQRGGPSLEQAPWAEPTAPAARKLPSVPRERKPALAALAVLLILGGALAVGYLMTSSAKRVAAIEISQPVGEGQQITSADMREVQIAANSGISYVPWSEANGVARSFASINIPAGTLLTPDMAVSANTLTNGKDVLGLALKDGQLPVGLAVGDRINIYEVGNAGGGCLGSPGKLLSSGAIVLKISSPSATSSSAVADVEVAVTPATSTTVGEVACNASNGTIGIAVAPGSALAPAAG